MSSNSLTLSKNTDVKNLNKCNRIRRIVIDEWRDACQCKFNGMRHWIGSVGGWMVETCLFASTLFSSFPVTYNPKFKLDLTIDWWLSYFVCYHLTGHFVCFSGEVDSASASLRLHSGRTCHGRQTFNFKLNRMTNAEDWHPTIHLHFFFHVFVSSLSSLVSIRRVPFESN